MTPFLSGADGGCYSRHTTPSAPTRWLRDIFLVVAATPPFQGGGNRLDYNLSQPHRPPRQHRRFKRGDSCTKNSSSSLDKSKSVAGTFGGSFDTDGKQRQLDQLQTLISDPNFWSDQERSSKTLQQRARLEETVE